MSEDVSLGTVPTYAILSYLTLVYNLNLGLRGVRLFLKPESKLGSQIWIGESMAVLRLLKAILRLDERRFKSSFYLMRKALVKHQSVYFPEGACMHT